MVRLVPRPDPPPIGGETHFRSLVRGLFAPPLLRLIEGHAAPGAPPLFTHRRKTLRNCVALLRDQELAGRVQGALETLGIDPGLRPEQLEVSDFAELSRLTLTAGRPLHLARRQLFARWASRAAQPV